MMVTSDEIIADTLNCEWMVGAWLFTVIDMMNLPIDKLKLKRLPLDEKIKMRDEMAALLPDPEED